MQLISTALAAHLAGEVTTLATCWKLTLNDSTVMGFTDHSTDITLDGQLYEAGSGFTPGAIASGDSLAVDDLEIEGIVDSSTISREDIIAGRFDYAELEVFIMNYQDSSQGKLLLKRGFLGEISLVNNRFVAEVRGLTEHMSCAIGNLYSPSCRIQFGDNSCKLNLASYTVTGTVTAVSSSREFSDSSRTEEVGYFSAGNLTFTSGANSGLSMEVKDVNAGMITLVLPFPYPVAVGDSYTMLAGCDKSFATCCSRFDNAVNFRGEPHVPGLDRMLQTAATS